MSTPSEARLAPSRDGSVVLDIGGTVGALIVLTASHHLGEELELTATSRVGHVHTEVRERQVAGGDVYAAVYPQLLAGEYELDCNGQRVSIRGGEITEVVLNEGTLVPGIPSQAQHVTPPPLTGEGNAC